MFVASWVLVAVAAALGIAVLLTILSAFAWYGIYLEHEQLKASRKLLQIDVMQGGCARCRGLSDRGLLLAQLENAHGVR